MRAFSISIALASSLAAGCEAAEDQAASPADAPLIGGVAASGRELDAIGSLVLVDTLVDCSSGEVFATTEAICTATLMSRQTVVTAKHCVEQMMQKMHPTSVPYFQIGADREHPLRRIEVIDGILASAGDEGWARNGRDVAALLLAERVTDIAPVELAPPTPALLGRRLAAIGYGARNTAREAGIRLAGNVTVNALEGKVYAAMFDGDYGAFRTWYLEGSDPGAPPGEEDIRRAYDEMVLLPGYEAHAGAREGDAQPCIGDSGGPLLESVGGKLVSFGVASGGVRSTSSLCGGGAVYALFGPETLALLDEVRTWEDPCEGLSTSGRCEGTVARRCTKQGEGSRRTIVTDCAMLGQTCAVDATGAAVCAASSADAGALTPALPSECADT